MNYEQLFVYTSPVSLLLFCWCVANARFRALLERLALASIGSRTRPWQERKAGARP